MNAFFELHNNNRDIAQFRKRLNSLSNAYLSLSQKGQLPRAGVGTNLCKHAKKRHFISSWKRIQLIVSPLNFIIINIQIKIHCFSRFFFVWLSKASFCFFTWRVRMRPDFSHCALLTSSSSPRSRSRREEKKRGRKTAAHAKMMMTGKCENIVSKGGHYSRFRQRHLLAQDEP